MKSRRYKLGAGNSGAVAVAAALGLAAFVGFAALALDIGHIFSIKNELQRAADAGALAGARALWPFTLPIFAGPPTQVDCEAAQIAAASVSSNCNNKVNGAALPSGQVTVLTGRWEYAAQTFTAGTGPNVNAVRVSAQAPVVMGFAKIFGIGSINISATATALIDFANQVGKGTIPIAISQHAVTPGQALYINFTPDPEDTGGWFADPPASANAKTFRDYINNANCPPLTVGDIINLQNGQDTSVLTDLANKLAEYGGTWDVVLPVVNTDKFNGSQPITGFVPFRITQVTNNGNEKGVTGTILGLYMSGIAAPGGPNFGVVVSPKLF